jgi:arylsulfatase A-like enzyme
MSFPRRGSIAIRRTLPPLVAALVVAACTPAGPGNGRESPAPTGVAGGARPDVVLVLLDDARWDDLVAMPRTRALIGDEGVRFTSAYVVNPSCCPSRASILTGGYSHTTGVFANHPPYGGRPVFQQRGGESANIATSLHEAGYRTALIGKYMNANREPAPAPGWDRYFAFFDMNGRYYDYTISDDGDVVRFGDAPDDYSTDVFLRRATSFIRSTPSDQPLFLYFTPFAPHNVTVPAPGDEDAFATETWEPPPSFDERDVSDKPAYIRSSPPVRIEQAQRLWRGRLATLSAVDRAVESILETLADEHRLSDAVVIVTSDNGLALGEHRWRFKGAPYEEVIRVPLLLRIDRFDGVPARIRELALNIDLAPTIADLAGLEPLADADGRSLVPLLRRGADRWRRGFLLENAVDHAQHLQIPSYCGYHSRRFVYVRYATGESELYDLRRDPFQLDNRAGDVGYRSVQDRMARLARSGCRPAPPEFSWVGTPAA